MAETMSAPAAECFRFEDDGSIPNNPKLPLLLYRGALDTSGDAAARCESLFAAHGWSGGWRNGIFSYHHYHSDAHEALGIIRGEAEVQLGGERGAVLRVKAGDVIVIPAGVGHKNLGSSSDFLVVGAYPDGRQPDLCRGRPEERPGVLDNIARVSLPAADPVAGDDGPLLKNWRTAG
jgi:uncharacterized protein YjlB